MEDYKQEIKNTRIGCLGGSDGKMLCQIANLGYVPQSAKKRLAVLKGLIPNEEIPYTAAVRTGDEIEQAIFAHLSQDNDAYESNPRLESKKYSRENVKLIAHPDVLLVDESKETIFVYEIKATNKTPEQTRDAYVSQLYIENLLAKELAATKGRKWKVKLALVHYSTSGLDLEKGVVFDPDRMTVKAVRFRTPVFDLDKAMEIVDEFVGSLEFFTEDEVIEAQYLPAEIADKFAHIANTLRSIKNQQDEVDAFRAKLYDFLADKGIKKVDCDDFSFAVVAPTQQVTFDHKKYISDLEAQHPRIAKRVKEQYKKITPKKGFVQIKIKN